MVCVSQAETAFSHLISNRSAPTVVCNGSQIRYNQPIFYFKVFSFDNKSVSLPGKQKNTMDKEEVKSQEAIGYGDINDIDWENRTLCRDGNCIGVIGANGRCTECGLIYDASRESDDKFQPDDIAVIETDDAVYDDTSADEGDNTIDKRDEFRNVEDVDEDEFVPDSDWENRTLCRDGNCIGIIGQDGYCRECGKKLESVDGLSGAA